MTSQADSKFRFLRVNPFRGLLVDENTWADAHDYHRNQMRFHLLALHGAGVAHGLDVVASQPPDMSVIVRPGLAIDPEGRFLLLSEQQLVPIPPQNKLETIYVVVEYNEKPTMIQAQTDGGQGQPARILEECVVRATPDPPTIGIEVARISLEPGPRQQIRTPINPLQPGNNEIDMTSRPVVNTGGGAGGKQNKVSLSMGILRYGAATSTEWKRHSDGIRRLVRDCGEHLGVDATVMEGISPLDDLKSIKMLYLTGRTSFRYNQEEEQALRKFLDKGGLLFCEPCRSGLPNGTPDEFSRSCIELASRLNRQPIQPRLGHPLLSANYLFSNPPAGIDPTGVVVEASRMIIATSDYGCLWEGKGQERAEAPTREVLRAAQEFGSNILFYAGGQN